MLGYVRQILHRWTRSRGSDRLEIAADQAGVTVMRDGRATAMAFRWDEVREIRTFKRDLGIVDDIRLAFLAGDRWFELSEDWKGFLPLAERMRTIFPGIPEDWFCRVMQPPFATNETTLYRREAGP